MEEESPFERSFVCLTVTNVNIGIDIVFATVIAIARTYVFTTSSKCLAKSADFVLINVSSFSSQALFL